MASNILPIRRDIKFKLNHSRILKWHKRGMNVAMFYDTLSLFFPPGERFFIDSVRNYRDQITDPKLKKAVDAFIGQEVMHTREHQDYNEGVHKAGLPTAIQEDMVDRLLRFVQIATPKSFQLAVTMALEHHTALLADGILDLDGLMKDADPDFRALWQWHALEECEHKGVAFDVYQACVGTDDKAGVYATRVIAQLLATSIFLGLQLGFYTYNLGVKRSLLDIGGWINAYKETVGKDGILRHIAAGWAPWFKPGFHPWDHNNSFYLDQLDERLAYVLKDIKTA